MKNVPHPNWVPADAPEALGAIAVDTPVAAVADGGGIAATPAPNPWANPTSAFNRPAAAPSVGEKHRHATRADEAIAFLKKHGPSAPGELAKAMGITSKGGVSPFIGRALKDGRIVRVDGKYSLPGASEEAGKSSEPTPAITPVAPTVAEAAAAIAAMRQPPADTAPEAISHFEAATAIVAKRKPRTPQATPGSASIPEVEPAQLPGRKPEFVVFAGDIQLLSWPNGDITLQAETCSLDLRHPHIRALMALIELRK